MRFKFAIRALAAAAALGALTAGASAQGEPFRLIVTELETPLVQNSVMHLAKQLGYFEREGVNVEIVMVQQTPSAVAALTSGEGEMANISTDAALQLVARDQLDIVAVTSPNKFLPFLIASKEEIATVADLAGKNFGVGRVGSLDYSLSNMVIANAGLDPETVNWVAIGQPPARGQALAAGQIDATTMSIGVWQQIPDRSGLHILVGVADYGDAAPVVNKVNVVTRETLETRRADVEAVVRALTKLSRDFNNNPQMWVDAMVTARPDVPRESLEQLAEAFQDSWSVNGGMSKEELEFSVEEIYKSEDFAGVAKVELADWVDFSVVDKVIADLGVDEAADEPTR